MVNLRRKQFIVIDVMKVVERRRMPVKSAAMRGYGTVLAVAGVFLAGRGGGGDVSAPAAPETRGGATPVASSAAGGDTGSSAGGAGFVEVLSALSADGPAATFLEYGDMAHWRSLGIVTTRP
ncbi:hypothetical protein SAMN05421505_10519 [Sinosporangium album]|uniref:Uncharacterized protein n=1 Tax=Sinosporangium album TaxID=504805 RepID=A0A1G7UXI7_9ACTN|nr:hypothetical protein SAMN05421505_10519 [Sinosporangium album]